MTRTLTVPARFWQDHLERACRCGESCPDKEAHEDDDGTRVSDGIRVTLNDVDFNELLSDALFYSDAVQMMGPEYIGLQSSARATVQRIQKAKENSK